MPKWTPKRTLVIVGLLALPTLGLAQQVQRMVSLTLNGKAQTDKALIVNGKAYVPLSSLREFGLSGTLTPSGLSVTGTATASSGGANPLPAVAGCLNETLFNGVWRFRVVRVEEGRNAFDRPLRILTVELRNGTQQTLQPSASGFDGVGSGILLEDDAGTQYNLDVGAYQLDNGGIFKAIPRGAGLTMRWPFGYPSNRDTSNTGKLSKLVIPINSRFWKPFAPPNTRIADPSFRVDLTCTK